MGETIEALVDAGKASAGPPLGPSLGPTGVNVKDVVAEINSKTKEMAVLYRHLLENDKMELQKYRYYLQFQDHLCLLQLQ